MLTYSFENIGKEPLYTHLYKCMKEDILQGTLCAGERLPSKRALAKQLNISTITIENAYAMLQTEGYIYSLPKKGYYVAELSPSISDSPYHHVEITSSLPSTSISDPNIWSDNFKIKMPDEPYLIDFSSNQTMRDNFPFSTWTRLVRQVMAEQGEHLMKNAPAGGIYELRHAIASHLSAFRDMHVSPEQIIIGAGTDYLYGLLIQLLGFNSIYAMENPGYEKIHHVYTAHGAKCIYIDLDQDGMRVDLLEHCEANVLHISPSHHFPTGITMPISRRYELLAWAARQDNRYIIEDDYDSEFRLTGKPIPTLQSIDRSERVIYMNTFTKSLASTIRISYMVLPPTLLSQFYDKLGFYSCTVSNFEQYTLARFIKDGYYEKHINRMRNAYRKKRNTLLDAIEASRLSSIAYVTEEDAGLHFLLHIHSLLSEADIIRRADANGVRIKGLSGYYHNTADHNPQSVTWTPDITKKQTGKPSMTNQPVHSFVINYSNIDDSHIQEAVDILYHAAIL